MNPEQIKKIIQDKIIGVWEPRHTDSGHRYCHLPSGTIQHSVTTKLGILSKPHLLAWSVKVGIEWLLQFDRINRLQTERFRDDMIRGAQIAHTDIRDESGSIGTTTHQICERFLNEWLYTNIKPESILTFVPPNCDLRSIAGARSFELLCNQKEIIPIASELICGHPKYSAGAIDILCLWGPKKELCLLDIKTSNFVDKNFRYQLAAYSKMFEFMCPELKIKRVKILHLDKGMDKYGVYDVKDIGNAWKVFKHICFIYDDIMSNKDKVIKDVKRLAI